MSRRPTTPDRVVVARCGRRGSAMAGMARAPRYTAIVLQFQWFLLLRNRWGARNSLRGVFYWWGALEQDTRRQGDGDPWGLNPDLSVEMKDNSIGEESRRSRPNYNRLGTLRLSDRYTNSRDRCDLVEHDNPATRAPVLQAIEELARTSRTSTELWDEYEVH
jgi:hypothetical protein